MTQIQQQFLASPLVKQIQIYKVAVKMEKYELIDHLLKAFPLPERKQFLNKI
jgi:hypothetical protein